MSKLIHHGYGYPVRIAFIKDHFSSCTVLIETMSHMEVLFKMVLEREVKEWCTSVG